MPGSLPRSLLPLAMALLAALPACKKNVIDPSRDLRLGSVLELQFLELPRQRFPEHGEATSCIALGDVNDDGMVDAVFGNRGRNRLYLNDRFGDFVDAPDGALPADQDETRAAVLGDVDGDGDLDLITGNGGDQAALDRLYLGDGKGGFQEATGRLPGLRERTRSLGLEDVDGDGDLDLVRAVEEAQNRLLLNDGQGRFVDATAARMPPDSDRSLQVLFADVDGDGSRDLLVANDGRDRLYLNDGKGLFSDASNGRLPDDRDPTQSVAAGDVDGDGDLDLVWGLRASSPAFRATMRLYLNDGQGRFADASAARLPPTTEGVPALALVDVDDDGDLDLVAASAGATSGVQNRFFRNDGEGTFDESSRPDLPVVDAEVRTLVLADVDQDNDPDVVLGTDRRPMLLCNLQRQLDVPGPPRVGQSYRVVFFGHGGGEEFPQTIDLHVNIDEYRPRAPIPPHGFWGLALAGLLRYPPIAMHSPSGSQFVDLQIPADPALVGITLHLQAVLVSVEELERWRLTNVRRDVIGG